MIKRIVLWSLLCLAVLLGLGLWNGMNPSWKRPELGTQLAAGSTPSDLATQRPEKECRVLALNLANLGQLQGGMSFAEDFEVRERLRQAANLIRESNADIVCLSEVVFEAGSSDVNQVLELASATGLTHWSYGDNYRFGLPFYGIREGNAILSRYPLSALFVQQLSGSASPWNPDGARRLLLCSTSIAGQSLRIGSVRTDAEDLDRNLSQCRAILDSLKAEQVVLAGDFYAEPMDAPMQLFKTSGLFGEILARPSSLPAADRRMNYVLAPRDWQLISEQELKHEVSGHPALLAHFRLP